MQKKISNEKLLSKISSAAYSFKELGYYDSKDKAIKALLKRKGFEGYSLQTAINHFIGHLKETLLEKNPQAPQEMIQFALDLYELLPSII